MRLFAVAVITFISLQHSPQQPSISNNAASAHGEHPAYQSTPKPIPAISASTPPTEDNTNPKKAEHQADFQDKTYRVQVVSQPTDYWNRAYVVITGLLATIGIFTLIMLYRQTKAAHNAERGRLDIIFELSGGIEGGRLFQFNVNNSGRSEVRILNWKLYLSSGDRKSSYKKPGMFVSTPFFEQSSNAILHKEKGVNLKNFRDTDIFPTDVRTGDRIVYLTGIVRYIDIFDQCHLTRVAYSSDGKMIEFLPRYARYK